MTFPRMPHAVAYTESRALNARPWGEGHVMG